MALAEIVRENVAILDNVAVNVALTNNDSYICRAIVVVKVTDALIDR